jgi:hypothetical protein
MENQLTITEQYLAKLGVLIAYNTESELTEPQKIDDVQSFKDDFGLDFMPTQLDSDDDAMEIVHNISQITLEDDTLTESERTEIIENCYDLLTSF